MKESFLPILPFILWTSNGFAASGLFGDELLTLDVPQLSPEVMRIINYPMSYDLTKSVVYLSLSAHRLP